MLSSMFGRRHRGPNQQAKNKMSQRKSVLFRATDGVAKEVEEFKPTKSHKNLAGVDEEGVTEDERMLEGVEHEVVNEEGEEDQEGEEDDEDEEGKTLRRTKGVPPLRRGVPHLGAEQQDIFSGHLPPQMVKKLSGVLPKPSFKKKSSRQSFLFRVSDGGAKQVDDFRRTASQQSLMEEDEEDEESSHPIRRASAPGGSITRMRTNTLRGREYYYDR